MTAVNEHTGAYLLNKKTTDAYRDNYDRIFGKKEQALSQEQQAAVDDTADIEKDDNAIQS